MQVIIEDGACNDARNMEYAMRGEIYGGDPACAHRWMWTLDDGNGHMGFVCSHCDAYRI